MTVGNIDKDNDTTVVHQMRPARRFQVEQEERKVCTFARLRLAIADQGGASYVRPHNNQFS